LRHIIYYLAIGIVLVAVVGVSACDLDSRKEVPFKEPPGGVLLSEEALIADCARAVGSEQEAVELVTQRLAEISAVELIRIPGDINKQTLLKIRAQDFERNGEPAFLVYIYYKAEYGSGYGDGQVVVEVTTDGKIYGTASAEPTAPGN
jgi:hypothetical protein